MAKRRRRSYIVHMELPEGITVNEGKYFILKAILGERNNWLPTPKWGNLNLESIKVTLPRPRSSRIQDRS